MLLISFINNINTFFFSVKALVVSIEDVGEITLPENAVELTASVNSQTVTGTTIFVSCPSRNPKQEIRNINTQTLVLVFTLRKLLYI